MPQPARFAEVHGIPLTSYLPGTLADKVQVQYKQVPSSMPQHTLHMMIFPRGVPRRMFYVRSIHTTTTTTTTTFGVCNRARHKSDAT